MSTASTVLIAIANELAKQAKENLPELQEGEEIVSEWLENGVYCRKTRLAGVSYISQYNFKYRKSRRETVGGNKNVRDR